MRFKLSVVRARTRNLRVLGQGVQRIGFLDKSDGCRFQHELLDVFPPSVYNVASNSKSSIISVSVFCAEPRLCCKSEISCCKDCTRSS